MGLRFVGRIWSAFFIKTGCRSQLQWWYWFNTHFFKTFFGNFIFVSILFLNGNIVVIPDLLKLSYITLFLFQFSWIFHVLKHVYVCVYVYYMCVIVCVCLFLCLCLFPFTINTVVVMLLQGSIISKSNTLIKWILKRTTSQKRVNKTGETVTNTWCLIPLKYGGDFYSKSLFGQIYGGLFYVRGVSCHGGVS